MTIIILLVIIGVVGVVGGTWAMGLYNGLVALRQNVDTTYANIDVALKQRHDEIPKLVAACEGYKNFERSTLEAVMKARARYTAASSPNEKIAAAGAVSGALHGLLAVAESYPDLKASQNFIQLQGRVSALEDRIAGQRESFNGAVNNYNVGIQQVPALYVARILKYQPREMLQVAESDKEDVKVEFK